MLYLLALRDKSDVWSHTILEHPIDYRKIDSPDTQGTIIHAIGDAAKKSPWERHVQEDWVEIRVIPIDSFPIVIEAMMMPPSNGRGIPGPAEVESE